MYEGEFRPGMVFECVSGPLMGERRTLVGLLWSGVWNCASSTIASEAWLRGFTRLVSAPPVEESIAQPAARPLAEGWKRLTAKDHSYFPGGCVCWFGAHRGANVRAEFRVRTPDGGSRNACKACAERAGVFADVVSRAGEGGAARNGEQARSSKDGPVPTAPVPAPPSCNWTCSREHGTHGPRCGKADGAKVASGLAERWEMLKKQRAVVGAYGDDGNRHRDTDNEAAYLAWASAQHGLPPGPRPPEPRIRDCYREGDGADPDYTGTEVR